jgi:cytoskeletal protein RodZ
MDVGADLRTAREQRGMSVADLAERTKISPRILRALETGDAAALPAPVFVRGFVRAYAREVGLDPDHIVNGYMADAAPPDAPVATEPSVAGPRDRATAPASNAVYLSEGNGPAGISAALGLAALALAIVAYLGLNGTTSPPAAAPAEPPSQAVSAAGGASAGAAEVTPVATTGATTVATSDAITLAIHPTGLCWVEVRVNGEARVYRLMEGGDRETITADGEVLLRVGDPTQFAYSINGRPGRPLGITSQPVTVRIDAATAQQLAG